MRASRSLAEGWVALRFSPQGSETSFTLIQPRLCFYAQGKSKGSPHLKVRLTSTESRVLWDTRGGFPEAGNVRRESEKVVRTAMEVRCLE